MCVKYAFVLITQFNIISLRGVLGKIKCARLIVLCVVGSVHDFGSFSTKLRNKTKDICWGFAGSGSKT